jgi:hypothetical protein
VVKEWDYGYPTQRRESKSDQELREQTKLVIDEFLAMFGSSGRGWINSDI